MAAAMVEMAAAIFIQVPVLFDRWPNGQPPSTQNLQTRMMRATRWQYSPRVVPINFHLSVWPLRGHLAARG